MRIEHNKSASSIKIFATLLLFLSLSAFLVSIYFEGQHPAFYWLRAFSEAAMVGALADWFAVAALFKHPLGIPIPHTAIIPNNQSRIAATLSKFVQDNFLHPDSLGPKLNSSRLGVKLMTWLSNPGAARTLANQIKDLLSTVLRSMDDKVISDFILKAIPALGSQIKIAPIVAEVIASVRAGDKEGALFNQILKLVDKLLLKHKEVLEGLVSSELPWYIPSFVKHHLYKQVTEAIRRTMEAMQSNPDHELRKQITLILDHALVELRDNILWEQRLQKIISQLSEQGTFTVYLGNLKKIILERLSNQEEKLFTESIEILINYSAQSVLKDSDISAKLDQLLAQMMLRIVKDYGGRAGSFIEETMKTWDSKVLSSKVEAEVGRDLQFIRINGTIVGGLVGVLIHAFLQLLNK